MELPVFLMVESTPNPSEMEAMQDYVSQATRITKKYGGVTIATYHVEKMLEKVCKGDKAAKFSVISFPNRDAIKALFCDPVYKALAVKRDLGFSHLRYHLVNEPI